MKVYDITTEAEAEVNIYAAGVVCPEHGLSKVDGHLKCWIVAKDNDTVKVDYVIAPGTCAWYIDLVLDGVLVESRHTRATTAARQFDCFQACYWRADDSVSVYPASMKFAVRETGSFIGAPNAPQIGTIEVLLYKYEESNGSHEPDFTSVFDKNRSAPAVNLARTNGMNPPTHYIKFVKSSTTITAAKKSTLKKKFEQNRPGLCPWSTFKFEYRSEAALRRQGIVSDQSIPTNKTVMAFYSAGSVSAPAALPAIAPNEDQNHNASEEVLDSADLQDSLHDTKAAENHTPEAQQNLANDLFCKDSQGAEGDDLEGEVGYGPDIPHVEPDTPMFAQDFEHYTRNLDPITSLPRAPVARMHTGLPLASAMANAVAGGREISGSSGLVGLQAGVGQLSDTAPTSTLPFAHQDSDDDFDTSMAGVGSSDISATKSLTPARAANSDDLAKTLRRPMNLPNGGDHQDKHKTTVLLNGNGPGTQNRENECFTKLEKRRSDLISEEEEVDAEYATFLCKDIEEIEARIRSKRLRMQGGSN